MERREFLLSAGATGIAFASMPSSATGQSASSATQVDGVQRLRVGSTVVTALSDGYVNIITPQSQVLQGIDVDTYEATIVASGRGAGARQTDINAYLVDIGGRKVMIDAGTNRGFLPTLGRTHAALLASGTDPAEVTDILITHLHPDHSAGLLAEDGSALYPNARVLVHEREYDYWVNGDATERGRPDMEPQFQLAKAAAQVSGDRLELFSGEDIGLPGISAVPLFGHTPGHIGCMIEDGGDRVFVVADIVHHSVIQLTHPEVSVAFDVDQDEARATRTSVLDRAAADGERIIGMHLPFPGAGRVDRFANGFQWIAEEREYF